jgi:hypothetical protein
MHSQVKLCGGRHVGGSSTRGWRAQSCGGGTPIPSAKKGVRAGSPFMGSTRLANPNLNYIIFMLIKKIMWLLILKFMKLVEIYTNCSKFLY